MASYCTNFRLTLNSFTIWMFWWGVVQVGNVKDWVDRRALMYLTWTVYSGLKLACNYINILFPWTVCSCIFLCWLHRNNMLSVQGVYSRLSACTCVGCWWWLNSMFYVHNPSLYPSNILKNPPPNIMSLSAECILPIVMFCHFAIVY